MFSWLKKKKKDTSWINDTTKKNLNFDDNDAKELLQDIKQEFGLDYEKQEYITLRKIERFAIKNNLCNFIELKNALRNSAELKIKLINMLTVGETYFYREIGHLKILAEYMKEKRVQNILCAPSSSGEEVYSILIFLKEINNDNIRITGIDLNSDAISVAQKGCYRERSLTPLPPKLRNKYFTKTENKYCIDVLFKQNTYFLHQNIFDDSFLKLGKFEVIFCRNMLIYFNETQKKKALANIYTLLPVGGLLFVGHADISFVPKGFIKKIATNGSYYIKK